MPALLPAPGVIKTRLFFSDGARTASISHYWGATLSGGYSQSQVDALTTAVVTAYAANLMIVHPNTVTLTHCEGVDLTSDTSPVSDVASGAVGGAGTVSLPLNVAMVVKHIIARRYRGGHGHVFLPFLTQSLDINGETFDPTVTAAVTEAYQDFAQAVASTDIGSGEHEELGVLSRFTGHAERGTPVFMICNDNVAVQGRVCSRRRRLPKIIG